jgi:hypothetical protein
MSRPHQVLEVEQDHSVQYRGRVLRAGQYQTYSPSLFSVLAADVAQGPPTEGSGTED